MFEGSRDAYEGYLQNQLRQRDAQAREKAATNGAAIGLIGAALLKNRQLASDLAAENEELHARIAKLELTLLVEKAHAEGLEAYLDAFKAAHPASPVLADSGKRYSDGDVKSAGRIRYERAFDAFLAGKIKNPERYRAD